MALVATGIVYSSAQMLQQQVSLYILVFTFCSTLLVYNADRLFATGADDSNVPARSAFIRKYRPWFYTVSVLCLLVIAYTAFKLEELQLRVAVLSMLTLALYYLLVYQLEVYWLAASKAFLLALVWVLVTVGLAWPEPLVKMRLTPVYLLLMAGRFILFAVNALWFDLRDCRGDRLAAKVNLLSSFRVGQYFWLQFTLSVLALVTITCLAIYFHYKFLFMAPAALGYLAILCVFRALHNAGRPIEQLITRGWFAREWFYPAVIDGLLLAEAFCFLMLTAIGQMTTAY